MTTRQFKVTIAVRRESHIDITIWYRVQATTVAQAMNRGIAQLRGEYPGDLAEHVRRVTVTMERVVAP